MSHENQTEQTLIDILTMRENQWTYRSDIKTEDALWENLRRHINRINVAQLDGEPLTDSEFRQVKSEFRRLTQTPFLASQWLRGENGVAQIAIEREDISKDDATLTLFSNKDIAGGISSYEVVNQIVPSMDGAYKSARGDVTLLINGLPVIHIELKSEVGKGGYMEGFDQIERYAQAGFFDGIYATVQIFVVSNKVATRYFARPNTNSDFGGAKKFLFNWREPDNTPVEDLYDFTRKVLKIPAAHELISRYTILVDDKKGQKFMMVLRPYQIHAIEKIKKQVAAHEGGFIWHATGSGKTITSFVATKLLAQTAIGVARTVMIVDRKDLDSQTKNEFSKFASEYNTGATSGEATDNTLIVGINNKRELVENFISKKNSNTIIITTIQKLSRAIRECRETEKNKFEKLKGEHIVFIVDECHRAVSDREMKAIKKFFPRSTWFGFTGTPIFEENKKPEDGANARITYDQYGELLHAYTTKNAMDDKSVLDFQVEYHTLMSEDEEQRLYLSKTTPEELETMSNLQKEALLVNADYTGDTYITAMLHKVFRHQSVIDKFKVVNGTPTMSGILTTHSIAQAKRIYRKLMELKESGNLITGRPNDERRRLNDPDFPRVAITYSLSEKQSEKNKEADELLEIMREYDATFGTHYAEGARRVRKTSKDGDYEDETDPGRSPDGELLGYATEIDDRNYNTNINNRLARKGAQYQTNGQWLDLVIVVERLLTGFDAPTVQALYIDKELKWHGLLQAFSRTNRVMSGKDIGMIVTFRKPWTMRKNVEDAFRLFSQEEREWEKLIPREYKAVRKELKNAYKAFVCAQKELELDPHDPMKMMEAIKTFQNMQNLGMAAKSYDEYNEELENDPTELTAISEVIADNTGHIENIKAALRELLPETPPKEAFEIDFSPDQRATLEEKIDSYYIRQLLKDFNNESSRQKFYETIKNKPPIVKMAYDEALGGLSAGDDILANVDRHFRLTIDEIITEAAATLKVPEEDLLISFNEYNSNKAEVPYINVINNKSALTKDEFERVFPGEMFRRRSIVREEYWRKKIAILMPLKEELVNFGDILKGFER
ncbi:MAG: DEAD/DEAH box helicase family protein [Clostridiales bacterium]|jgi:type I restriction enzyme R subunit|nr:DEAD/DEAH box helicase family protein [Clostridiales bacterium]